MEHRHTSTNHKYRHQTTSSDIRRATGSHQEGLIDLDADMMAIREEIKELMKPQRTGEGATKTKTHLNPSRVRRLLLRRLNRLLWTGKKPVGLNEETKENLIELLQNVTPNTIGELTEDQIHSLAARGLAMGEVMACFICGYATRLRQSLT